MHIKKGTGWFESDWILLSDVSQWASLSKKNGTVMALILIGSCSLMWANELPCLKRTAQCWLWIWLDHALLREPMSFLVFSSAKVMDVKDGMVLTAQCWLWIWLDLALWLEPMSLRRGDEREEFWLDPAFWREPMSFLVFSSATVMDVKNDTMLAVSTSLHGCQLLAGIIGNQS